MMSDTSYDEMVGERAASVRGLLGITLADAATNLGCTRQTLSNYESGRTPMRARHAMELSRFYGIRVGWLLGEEDKLEVHYERDGRKVDAVMLCQPIDVGIEVDDDS